MGSFFFKRSIRSRGHLGKGPKSQQQSRVLVTRALTSNEASTMDGYIPDRTYALHGKEVRPPKDTGLNCRFLLAAI